LSERGTERSSERSTGGSIENGAEESVEGGAEDSFAVDGEDGDTVGEPGRTRGPQDTAEVDRVFTALADPTRRQVLQLLAEGRPLSASALAGRLPVSRQAVVQHLAVLQQSNLVSSRRSGREVLFSVEPEALTLTASWMTRLAETWSERLALLKRIAEAAESAD
jgi:DNA-binding transcriptional ArsR family regulator